MQVDDGKVAQADPANAELKIPWDLSQWADSSQLLAWVQEDVETLDWNNPRIIAMLEAQPEYRPKMLLTLLTWAYASGRFESAEICEACFEVPELRQLCQDHPPTERSVVSFRRDNRGLLRWTLLRLLKRALRHRFQLDQRSLPPGLNRFLDNSVVLRLDVAREVERGSTGF